MSENNPNIYLNRGITYAILAILLYLGWFFLIKKKSNSTPNNNVRNTEIVRPSTSGSQSQSSSQPSLTLPPLQLLTQKTNPKVKLAVCLNDIFLDSNLNIILDSFTDLLTISQNCDVYLMSTCASRQDEEKILSQLMKEQVLKFGIEKHKILFSKTEAGRHIIYRHIEPHVCLDPNAMVIEKIAKYIPIVGVVGKEAEIVKNSPKLIDLKIKHYPSFSEFLHAPSL